MKQWTVYFRDKNGSKASVVIEAEDRSGVFAELKKRGISAISVSEGASNKKPRKVASGGASAKWRGLIAAAIVVLGAGIVAWWMMKGEEKGVEEVKKRVEKQVIEMKKDVVKVAPQKIVDSNAVEKIDINRIYRDKKGKVIYNKDAPVGSPANPIKFGYVDRPGNHRPPKKLYNTFPENYLVGLLRTKPGMPVVNTKLPRNFDEVFKSRIADPVGFRDDDTEEDKELRQSVYDIKREMVQLIADGMTPSQVLLAEREELNKLAKLKSTVLREVSTLRKSGASQEEIDLAVEAGNKLLERYGVEHIKIPAFLKINNLNKVNKGE